MEAEASTFEDLVPGAKLAHYVITARVADGGMGTVFKAVEPALERYVAIKVLRTEWSVNPEQVQYFLQEAQAVAALRHPNIVPIYYVGQQQQIVFFSMAYIEGATLDDWIEAGHHMTPGEALWFLTQAISALQAASEAGIVHLDIKPSNFLIDKQTVLLADFGLAEKLGRALDDEEKPREAFGTPAYVAPEQIERGGTSARTDMYSLGASLYHLMVGQPPFDGPTVEEIVWGHLEKPFPMEAAQAAHVPSGWIFLIKKLMERRPEDRFQSYQDILGALQNINSFRYETGPLAPPPLAIAAVSPRSGYDPAHLHGLLRSKAAWAEEAARSGELSFTTQEVLEAYRHPMQPLAVHHLGKTVAALCSPQEGDVEDLLQACEKVPGFRQALMNLGKFLGALAQTTVNEEIEALEAVGLARARQLALTFFGLDFEWRGSAFYDWSPLWRHQMATGLMIDLMYEALDLRRTGFEYAAGAFHDIGKLVLAELYPYAYYTAMERSHQNQIGLAQAERALFGIDHAHLGNLWLRDQPDTPRALAEVTSLHETPHLIKSKSLLAHALVAANHLVKQLGIGFSGNSVMDPHPWAELPSVEILWEARRREDYAWETFIEDFAQRMETFPDLI